MPTTVTALTGRELGEVNRRPVSALGGILVRVLLAPYRRVLAVRRVRQVVLLGVVVRVPLFATLVALTIHVVTTLHRSYGWAGFLTAVGTICLAVSAPWRGRVLDRSGLRRVVAPAIVVQLLVWPVAPFLPFWPLLALAGASNLFAVPSFSIIRQAMMAETDPADRRTALALDSAAVEVAFMAGPLVGVWVATAFDTRWALLGLAMASLVADVVLWVVDPPVTHEEEQTDRVHWTKLLNGAFLQLCALAGAATLVLSGTDIALVAALRHLDALPSLGLVEALWGVGSFAGGLVYGALHRPIPAYALLAGLCAVTVPLAWAPTVWALALLASVAGLLCAPTLTAAVDQLSSLVPPGIRGEAMGWQGSAMTAGSAAGSPLAGIAVDRRGAGAGFLTVAVAGAVVAAAGAVGSARRAPAPPDAAVTPAGPPDVETTPHAEQVGNRIG